VDVVEELAPIGTLDYDDAIELLALRLVKGHHVYSAGLRLDIHHLSHIERPSNNIPRIAVASGVQPLVSQPASYFVASPEQSKEPHVGVNITKSRGARKDRTRSHPIQRRITNVLDFSRVGVTEIRHSTHTSCFFRLNRRSRSPEASC
jgi:hypothetical protein